MMTRRRRILVYKLFCILFGLVLLCLPYRGMPYSDLRVVATVLGIDGGVGEVTAAAQLAVPVAQNGDGKASTVATAKGGSISEALENLEIGLGRRVDYGHLSTVAIGEGMTLEDVTEHVSYLMSSGKAGPGAYLVYCNASKAVDFIEQAQQMGESSDAELGSLISYSKSGNHVATTTALRFLQTLNSSSHAAIMPCVELEGSESDAQPAAAGGTGGGGGQGSSSGGQSGQSSGGGTERKKLVAADTVAVYGGESELPVMLDAYTTKGVVWQDKNSDFGLVELRNVLVDGEEVKSLSTRITKKKVKRSVKRENGENVMEYKIKMKLRLDDSRICGSPLFYDKWKNAIEDEFESVIQNNLLAAVSFSKENKVDFLGIRETFRKFCREGFDSFELDNVVVTVKADVSIQT